MFRVLYKAKNAASAWSSYGSYGNEQSAMSVADRISGRYFVVRVVDPSGNTVWSL
jgi:hypothetical protein